MNYTLENGSIITIPKDEIELLQKTLKITQSEAIDTWLFDEGFKENSIEKELTKKAKENRITATIHQAKSTTEKKPRKPRPKKENPEKEAIIKKIAEILPEIAENITITNKTKLIEFNIGENQYKIDLIQRRKPKK